LTSYDTGKVLICKIDWETKILHFQHWRLFSVSTQCIGQLGWYSVSWRNWFVIRVAQLVPHVEQELLTLLEHLSSSPIFRRVCVGWSLVSRVMLCRSLFVFFCFHCIVCLSIYGFYLSLWYLGKILHF
jgi:hypothetical protein